MGEGKDKIIYIISQMQSLFPFLPSTVLCSTEFNQKMLTHIKNMSFSMESSSGSP